MSLHTRKSLIYASFIALLLTVSCQQTPSSEPAAPANDLFGVWSLTSVDPGNGSPLIDPSQPGLYIFKAGYYSAVFALGTSPRIKSDVSFQPTPEEMVAQYESIIVNAGTYEMNGSTVTFRPIISKYPGFVGGYKTRTFRVDGDTLVLSDYTLVSVDGNSRANFGGSLTLLRVE